MDDALDVGQADARALELVVAVQALEYAEQFVSITRIEPRAVVANGDYRLASPAGGAADSDDCMGAGGGKLHGVGEQIDQHQAQQGPVGPHRRQRADFPDDASCPRLCLKIAQSLLSQLIEINLHLSQFLVSEARERQQVINQTPHPACRLRNRGQMMEAFFGKRWADVLFQQFHEARDVAQRRAQIVGDGITERLQILVGLLQLRRAIDDALLQLRVEDTYLIFRPFALRDVANVALDHVARTGLIHVADKLHGNLAAVLRFQRQVFVADIPVLLQLLELGLVGHDVLERAKFPDGCSDQFAMGKAQQLDQERVHVADSPRVGFENQDAILRGFK